MRTKKITCDYARLRENILPQLRETVFHVTSGEGLAGIRSEKMILPNTNGRFNCSYPQSANSFGIKRKYICLFDLRDVSEKIIDITLDKFHFLSHHEWDINAFLILDAEACRNLIPNEAAKTEPHEIWIPKVEVWFPAPIPLERISSIIEVQVNKQTGE